jgi:hypothetical protein
MSFSCPSLYLPTKRIIDYKYLIKVEQETDLNLIPYYHIYTQNIITSFHIETLYLYNNESTDLKLEKQVLCSEDKVVNISIKQEHFRFLLSYLNQIEYILSIPLEDLATLINEPNDLDKLVYWRYSVPEPSKESMAELMRTPWFLNKISYHIYHITDPSIPVDRYPF